MSLNTTVPTNINDTYAVPSLPIENISNKEDKASKGIANGYAPLDGTGKVPEANLPVIDVSGQISTHNSATTSVHGIADTANLSLIGHTHAISDVTGLQTAIDNSGIKAGVQWTTRHTNSTGNPYLVGSIVYHNGRVYRCIAENDSMPPQQGGNPYWADLGVGYLLPNENPLIEGGTINTRTFVFPDETAGVVLSTGQSIPLDGTFNNKPIYNYNDGEFRVFFTSEGTQRWYVDSDGVIIATADEGNEPYPWLATWQTGGASVIKQSALSGGSINSGGGASGVGGSINTSDGGGSINTSGDGGSINTSGGADGVGGSINTSNYGGSINTSGVESSAGGSINTSGGGNINTSRGSGADGGMGGSIDLSGGDEDGSDGANGGSISLAGGTDGCSAGSIISNGGAGTGANGGTLNMSGGSDSNGGSINTSGANISGADEWDGGSINTSGGENGSGGSINTSNGGGSINTAGTTTDFVERITLPASCGQYAGSYINGLIVNPDYYKQNPQFQDWIKVGNGSNPDFIITLDGEVGGVYYLRDTTEYPWPTATTAESSNLTNWSSSGRIISITVSGFTGAYASSNGVYGSSGDGYYGNGITTMELQGNHLILGEPNLDTGSQQTLATKVGQNWVLSAGVTATSLTVTYNTGIPSTFIATSTNNTKTSGSIVTSGGGGSINTTDGYIDLGTPTTRTRLKSSLVNGLNIILPSRSGTLVLDDHTHRIGTNPNLPLITTTNGQISTGSFGITANTFCQGNDVRLNSYNVITMSHSSGTLTANNEEKYFANFTDSALSGLSSFPSGRNFVLPLAQKIYGFSLTYYLQGPSPANLPNAGVATLKYSIVEKSATDSDTTTPVGTITTVNVHNAVTLKTLSISGGHNIQLIQNRPYVIKLTGGTFTTFPNSLRSILMLWLRS